MWGPYLLPEKGRQGGGETGEQAELIKTFTGWLPSSLILFKLSHLPTLNGKLSQLLPASLRGPRPGEQGERANAAGLQPWPWTRGNCGSHGGGCHLPSASQRSAPGKPELGTWEDHSPAPLALEEGEELVSNSSNQAERGVTFLGSCPWESFSGRQHWLKR